LNPDPDLDPAFKLNPDPDPEYGSKPSKKGTLKNKLFINFVKSNLKLKKSEKAVLTMQKLEPYGAASSHIIGWSRSRSR
jgi:hypothetical protein